MPIVSRAELASAETLPRLAPQNEPSVWQRGISVLGSGLITFTSFDLRCYVRLALIVLVWKHASQDYGALSYLGGRSALYTHSLPIIQTISLFLQSTVLAPAYTPEAIQFLGVAACGLAIFWPTRLALVSALLSVAALEYAAFLWRYQDWDIDLPMVVLLLAVMSPVSLRRALSPTRAENYEANFLGRILATYMATMYCVAGLSKLVLPYYWPSMVQFGNNWKTQLLDIAPYGSVSGFFGEWASWFFLAFPTLATAIALFVMADQIFMPFALISRHFRVVGPFVVFLNHAGIALALGIFFSSMPFLGPGIFLPWSRLSPGRRTTTTVPVFNRGQKLAMLCGAGFAAVLIVWPGLTHTVYHPFADNFIFGWRYPAPATYKTVYAIGYFDGTSYVPIPRGHGGFMESRLNTALEVRAGLVAKDPRLFPALYEQVETLLCSLRPLDSNRRFLGVFALPEHRWSKFSEFKLGEHSELYLIEGTPDRLSTQEVIPVNWAPILSFKTPECR